MTPRDWIHHLEGLGETPAADLPPDPTLFEGTRGEQRLWSACAGRVADERLSAWLLETLGDRRGSLLPPDGFRAIEVWTECELSAVHALGRFRRHPDRSIAAFSGERLAEAVRWHIEHTQPDNATHRPWAVHEFLLAEDGTGDATAYAGTLLHNMSASDARVEPLSRWIVADAARELRLGGFGST